MPQDPAVAVPRSVRKQADEANRLMQELVEKGSPGKGQPTGETPAPDPTPKPAAAPAPADPSSGVSNVTPMPPKPEDTAEYWEQRFRVMQGKYNAEVPALQQRLNELEARLNAAPPPPVPAAANPSPQSFSSSAITDEEVNDYGEDFFNVVGRFVTDLIERKLAERVAPLATQVNEVATATKQTATDRYLAALTEMVPNWAAINVESGWLNWLDKVDPYAGVPRQQLLNDANGKLDAARVAAMFKGYLAEKAAAPSGQPTPTPQPQPRLQDFADPASVRAGAAQSALPSAGQLWTSAAINKFYEDKRRGLYQGREAEAAQIERDIHRAGMENRYRQA